VTCVATKLSNCCSENGSMEQSHSWECNNHSSGLDVMGGKCSLRGCKQHESEPYLETDESSHYRNLFVYDLFNITCHSD
jgi:hypothetical protein